MEEKGLNRPEYTEIKEFLERHEVRVCSVCGKAMVKGYYLDGEYACSDKCRNAIMSEKDYYAETEDEDSDYYWTEWENTLGIDIPALNNAVKNGQRVRIYVK